jgi:hypothetical protein
MKRILVSALILCIATTALATEVKKFYSYVCRNERCKEFKKVVTFEESVRHERKCTGCNNRLSPVN